jgi:hypothetical protein
MPLGGYLYKGSGKMNINRVISGGDGLEPPKVEISMQGTGQYLRVPVFEIWTIIATLKPDGSTMGDGQGIIFTRDPGNREIATATLRGVGNIQEDQEDDEEKVKGNLQFKKYFKNHSVIFYNVKNLSSRGQLAFLHNKVGMNEFETNEETLEYTNKIWEWK